MIEQCEEVTYVLRCMDGIYYVGKTTQLFNRLSKHWIGKGAKVTTRHHPLEVVGVFAGNVEKAANLYGRNKYGKDKCFGWTYHEGT